MAQQLAMQEPEWKPEFLEACREAGYSRVIGENNSMGNRVVRGEWDGEEPLIDGWPAMWQLKQKQEATEVSGGVGHTCVLSSWSTPRGSVDLQSTPR